MHIQLQLGAAYNLSMVQNRRCGKNKLGSIGGETNQDLTFTTALTQSTSFRREAISTFGPDPTICEVNSANLQ